MQSRSDGDDADPQDVPIEIPELVPERPPRLPKALPPEIVPATSPVNLAPFLPVPEEPQITSPIKGAILPPKKAEPPRSFDAFDEVTSTRFASDRWGVPLTAKERQRARQTAARKSGPIELSRPVRGVAVGLLVGLLAATGYAALAWTLGVEHLYASIIIALVVAWSMYLAWGRQSFAVGVWSALIAAASFLLAVVLAMAATAANDYPGDLTYWLLRIVDDPAWWAQTRLEQRPATSYFVLINALVAFVTSAGLWRRKLLNS